jgi:hypothetical protein
MPLKPLGYSRIPVFSGDASRARVTERGECQVKNKLLEVARYESKRLEKIVARQKQFLSNDPI